MQIEREADQLSYYIFNTDETEMFYHMLPDKRWNLTAVNATTITTRKDLIVAKMMDTEKLPLLVIGKFAKPLCCKNVKSPSTEQQTIMDDIRYVHHVATKCRLKIRMSIEKHRHGHRQLPRASRCQGTESD